MSTPINKEHDAEYWRQKYEEMREGMKEIFRMTKDDDSPYDDIVNDTEATAYRYLYENE